MKTKNTVELLSLSKKTKDLRNDMDNEFNLKFIVLNYYPNSRHLIRLLGPFYSAERLYVPKFNLVHSLTNILNRTVIRKILDRDKETYVKVISELNSELNSINSATKKSNKNLSQTYGGNDSSQTYGTYSYVSQDTYTLSQLIPSQPNNDEKITKDTLSFVSSLYGEKKWQKCVLINGFIKEATNSHGVSNKIKIIPLFRSLVSSICERNNNIDSLISGLYAHDLMISKNGFGMSSRTEGSLSFRPTHLLHDQIEDIIEHGLWDIPSVINKINEEMSGSYIYKLRENHQMPENLYEKLKEELSCYIKNKEENEHIHAAEDKIHQLPRSAFENIENSVGSIESLEI